MGNSVRLTIILLFSVPLTGCSGLMAYMESLQKQSVDEFEQRSVNFRPAYQFVKPKRGSLTPQEKRVVGDPPPPAGVVVLDGTRYFSANGHVCHQIKDQRSTTGDVRAACYVNGQWQMAVPVLNTSDSKN